MTSQGKDGASSAADTERSADELGSIQTLIQIMAQLRHPQTGCPWDVAQTFETIAPYTIEEAYEVAGAIEARDWSALKEELGDLLFQVIFHARMAEERDLFAFFDVVAAVNAKMVRRHPHVFGDARGISSAEAQTLAWEEHKRRERAVKPSAGLLADVPKALPALLRAIKLQKRAASVGFDWDSAPKVIEKIAEEAGEIAEAQAAGAGVAKLEEELGDLLFAVANLARHLRVDPETALRSANAKFERRFGAIERGLAARGKSPSDACLEEMEALWQAAKQSE